MGKRYLWSYIYTNIWAEEEQHADFNAQNQQPNITTMAKEFASVLFGHRFPLNEGDLIAFGEATEEQNLFLLGNPTSDGRQFVERIIVLHSTDNGATWWPTTVSPSAWEAVACTPVKVGEKSTIRPAVLHEVSRLLTSIRNGDDYNARVAGKVAVVGALYPIVVGKRADKEGRTTFRWTAVGLDDTTNQSPDFTQFSKEIEQIVADFVPYSAQ